MMPRVDWTAMPRDAPELISKKLQAFDPDYIRFRSVCNSWRSAAPKRPELPWLICRNWDHGHNPFFFFRLSLSSEGGRRILPVFELPSEILSMLGFEYLGRSHGWIILLDPTSISDIVLLNSVTGSTIHLPTRPLCTVAPLGRRCGCTPPVFLSSNPSSSDCVVLTVCYCHKLLYCRPHGDGSWTRLDCPEAEMTGNWHSQCCFCRGRFYVIACSYVYVYDVGTSTGFQKIMYAYSERLHSLKIKSYEFYLVESDGDVLLVFGYHDSVVADRGYSFIVFKLEWGEESNLVELGSLGDSALFVSWNNSFSLSATQFPGCKGNCIYYIYCVHEERVIRMYNLEDSSDALISDGAALPQGFGEQCAWFTPSLLP